MVSSVRSVTSFCVATLSSLSGTRHKDNNRAERALRTPVIGRKNFYGSGAEWAAHLAADVWTATVTGTAPSLSAC